MSRAIKYFLVVVTVMLAPVLFWLFGPLLFWPLSRKFLAADDKRIEHFRKIFLINMLLVVGGTLYLVLTVDFEAMDKIYLFSIPYSIGVILLIAGLVVFFIGRKKEQ